MTRRNSKAGRQQDESTGLDPETQAPFFDVLRQEAVGDAALIGDALDRMCALTVDLVEHVQQEIGIVGFWSKPVARDELRGWIFRTLDDADVVPFERLGVIADRLMELAKANHHRLVRSQEG